MTNHKNHFAYVNAMYTRTVLVHVNLVRELPYEYDCLMYLQV